MSPRPRAMGTGRSVTLGPAAPGSPLRLLAQAEPGGCGEGSGAVAAGCLSCAAGQGERLSAGGMDSGKGSYSSGRMKDAGQACKSAPTPLNLILETRARFAGTMRSAPAFPRGLMESSLVALLWKVALCPLVLGGMVLRSWRVGWEKGVMWLGPSEIAAGFCPRRLWCSARCGQAYGALRGDSGCRCPEQQYAVLLPAQSYCSLQGD